MILVTLSACCTFFFFLCCKHTEAELDQRNCPWSWHGFSRLRRCPWCWNLTENNPGPPPGSLISIFDMFPCSSTPGLLIELPLKCCRSLLITSLFKSGVLLQETCKTCRMVAWRTRVGHAWRGLLFKIQLLFFGLIGTLWITAVWDFLIYVLTHKEETRQQKSIIWKRWYHVLLLLKEFLAHRTVAA